MQSPVGCIFAKRIPRQVQAQQPETKQQCAERIPLLYVPLSIFRCLGAPFPSAEYHNLLHFVHKLLHPVLTASKSCTLFTNRLQTVADRKKLKIQCPGVPLPFPYKLRGKIRPMLTQTPAHPIEEDNDPEARPQPTVVANDEIVGQCHRSDSFRSCENSGRK
jgi:hypothetical protein